MKEFTALDVHKQYTFASVEQDGLVVCERKIVHERGAIRGFLAGRQAGSSVAVEATGNWYWVVDEIEEAGLVPRLVHPRKAKLMMGLTNKTDKLDARGLNVLQRNGTLPTVWIPPGELRDQRDLPRTRMMVTRHFPEAAYWMLKKDELNRDEREKRPQRPSPMKSVMGRAAV